MIIEADVDTRDKPVSITFTNNHLNNLNFLDMVIGIHAFTITFKDLEAVVEAFRVGYDEYQKTLE